MVQYVGAETARKKPKKPKSPQMSWEAQNRPKKVEIFLVAVLHSHIEKIK